MSYSGLPDQRTAIAAALAHLGMRVGDRVLIMLPDGPGFADLITCVARQGALPLPVNPELTAGDIVAAAAAASAQIVLTSADRMRALGDLNAQQLVFVDASQGPWIVGLRLSCGEGHSRYGSCDKS